MTFVSCILQWACYNEYSQTFKKGYKNGYRRDGNGNENGIRAS